MNPFHVFQRFLAADLEKRLTQFLVENRVFQYFAHRTSRKADEIARKVGEELQKNSSKPGSGGRLNK
jgi:hypothetical protein